MSSPQVFLRSSLAYDPIANPTTSPRTLDAFSPDIIPLGRGDSEPDHLARTYDHYIAHPLQTCVSNKVWLRGRALHQVTSPAVAHVKAVANEVILWPQVWNKERALGQLPLTSESHEIGSVYVSERSLSYIPHEGLGRHETFIATTRTGHNDDDFPDVENWRDLVRTIGKDNSLALRNVVTVDPTSPVISLTTRLRIFENEMDNVSLSIGLQCIGIPQTGLEASFFSTDTQGNPNDIVFPRSALSPTVRPSIPISLPAGFDGFIYLQVFNDNQILVPDRASVSLIVTGEIVVNQIPVIYLVGAEHIVFDSTARVSHYIEELNSTKYVPKFYFRSNLGEGENFPKQGIDSNSPDIQPYGPTPANNPEFLFSNFNTDLASNNHIKITSGASNYIYTRATATAADEGTIRLFAVPSAMLLHPSQYAQYDVKDVDEQNRPITAYRSYSASGPGNIVVANPFNLANPPPPHEVGSGSDHYCLVTEYLSNDSSSRLWPHEVVGDVTPGNEFVAWVLSEPAVAWRNMTFTFDPHGAESIVQSGFKIPPGFSTSDRWSIRLVCNNVPVGSAVSMTVYRTSDPSDDPNLNLNIAKTTVTNSNQRFSVGFTGVNPGFACTVTASWFRERTELVPGQSVRAELAWETLLTSPLGTAFGPSEMAARHRLVVFPDYPALANKFPGTKGDESWIHGAMDILPGIGTWEDDEGDDDRNQLRAPIRVVRSLGGDAMYHAN